MNLLRIANLLVFASLTLLLSGCATTTGDPTRNFNTVIVDAGHGGHDSGAHPRQRAKEKVLALDVAQRLNRKLKAAGIRTVMTRDSDVFIPLGMRTRISNAQRNAIFVSIHFNYSPKSHVQGIETYYYNIRDRDLAIAIESGAVAKTGANRRGVIRDRFYVLRNNRHPAVLVEGGYLTNASEAVRCQTESYREALAQGIAQAIIARRSPFTPSAGGGTIKRSGFRN